MWARYICAQMDGIDVRKRSQQNINLQHCRFLSDRQKLFDEKKLLKTSFSFLFCFIHWFFFFVVVFVVVFVHRIKTSFFLISIFFPLFYKFIFPLFFFFLMSK